MEVETGSRTSSMMLELIGARTGNCLRVAIALELAGADYMVRPLDLRAGEHRSPAHLRLNPAGKVPTLVDARSGEVFILSQSNAILLHLDQLYPGKLLPQQHLARAAALERFLYVLTEVIAPSHAACRLRRTGETEAAERLDEAAVDALRFVETYLAPGGNMAGEQFSLADIAGYTIATSYEDVLDWHAHPNLADWFRRAAQNQAVSRGMRAFD